VKSPLVTTAWLARQLENPQVRIVELRGKVLPPSKPPPHYFTDRAGYEHGHIPNAVFVDWQVDIVAPGSPLNDVAEPERFAALMGALGIGNDTTVVLYDNAASMLACRLRWALRYYGHEQVFILDGGWDKWLADGRPVSADIPQVETRQFEARINPRLKASAKDILAGLDTGDMQLIDVRSPAEYAGEASRARFGGHIPTAISIPRKTMLADDLTVKPAPELQRHFAERGVALNANDTVIYCNSGVSASFAMLALEIAGARNLRLYDGSWKEWGNDVATPKAI
jgi:thiosulfate/3-mercaptopyruvate sulfurtransferase